MCDTIVTFCLMDRRGFLWCEWEEESSSRLPLLVSTIIALKVMAAAYHHTARIPCRPAVATSTTTTNPPLLLHTHVLIPSSPSLVTLPPFPHPHCNTNIDPTCFPFSIRPSS